MLVLTRRIGDLVLVGDDIQVKIVDGEQKGWRSAVKDAEPSCYQTVT
jgi:sRNA-binding carbon storage regulator CsrA